MSVRRLFPHPLLSLVLTLLWGLAWNDATPLVLLSAPLIGTAIPVATRRFWPDAPKRVRPLPLLGFVARVLVDIVVANVAVARLALIDGPRVRPAWVELPVAIEDPFVLVLLANTVTLTPGTLSAELVDEGRTLRIHCLHLREDPEELRRHIRTRYEHALREAFSC